MKALEVGDRVIMHDREFIVTRVTSAGFTVREPNWLDWLLHGFRAAAAELRANLEGRTTRCSCVCGDVGLT